MSKHGPLLQFLAQAVITMVLVGAAWGYTQASVHGHGVQIEELKAEVRELRMEMNELENIETELATIRSDVSWIREDLRELKDLVRGGAARD